MRPPQRVVEGVERGHHGDDGHDLDVALLGHPRRDRTVVPAAGQSTRVGAQPVDDLDLGVGEGPGPVVGAVDVEGGQRRLAAAAQAAVHRGPGLGGNGSALGGVEPRAWRSDAMPGTLDLSRQIVPQRRTVGSLHGDSRSGAVGS